MNGENTRPGLDHAAQDSPIPNPHPLPLNFHPQNLHPQNFHPLKNLKNPQVGGIPPAPLLPPPTPAPTYSPTEDTTLKYCNGI